MKMNLHIAFNELPVVKVQDKVQLIHEGIPCFDIKGEPIYIYGVPSFFIFGKNAHDFTPNTLVLKEGDNYSVSFYLHGFGNFESPTALMLAIINEFLDKNTELKNYNWEFINMDCRR